MSFFEDESFDAVIDKGMALNLCYLFIFKLWTLMLS